MAEYQDYPIKTDPDELLADWIAELRTYWPNWEPDEGSLAYRAAAAFCRILATRADVAALVPGEIFRTAGRSLFNTPPSEGAAATADTTWTMIDNAGYTIPEGSVVSIEGVLFQTLADTIIPNGSTVVNAVSIQALDEGAAGSNLGVAGAAIRLEEGLAFVDNVTLDAPTAGGSDAEDQDTYTLRLVERLSLMTFLPILAPDLAKVARTVPGVYRATVLDNYDASTDTPNVGGHATVAVQDEAGGIVPVLIKDAVTALLTASNRRLLNAVIHVVDANYTPVDITVAGLTYPTADLVNTRAAVQGALEEFLDPTKWGLPSSGETPEWFNKPVVSLYDIAAAIDSVEGFDRATNIEIGLNGGAQASADANLPGVVPLPQVGVIDVSGVVAP